MDQVANRCNGSFPFAGIIDDKKPYEYLNMVAFTVLETYSNVHRGTGHFSLITTELLEKARQVILSCILDDSCGYELIFCTPRRAAAFGERIGGEAYLSVSSGDIGLPLGVTAIAVRRGSLPRGVPFETGGGTVTLVSRWSAVYGRPPERFEAGTPAVINCVLFAAALLMTCSHGPDIFWRNQEIMNRTSVYDILYDDDYANLSGGKLLEALKRSITGRNLHVPYEGGYRRYVNFDNAASTPALTPVYNAASSVLNLPDNLTDDVIEETERIIYRFLDAGENQYSIFFCLNTTEALHIAVQNFVRGLPDGEEPVVVNTACEHHSNELPWRYLPGVRMLRLPVDDSGAVDIQTLEDLFIKYNVSSRYDNQRIRLLSVCAVSNVTGFVADISLLSTIAHRYGARIIVDGAQLVAHRAVSLNEADIDYFVFSGHKMYAPFGSGALIIRRSLVCYGEEEQEFISASGRENAYGIAALGKAMILLERIGIDTIAKEDNRLMNRFLTQAADLSGLKIHGTVPHSNRRETDNTGVLVFSMQNVPHNVIASELAERGAIGVRNGCFCAHIFVKQLLRIHPVRELAAELLSRAVNRPIGDLLPGLVRISIGLENSDEEIDHLVHVLQQISSCRRTILDRFLSWSGNGNPFLRHLKSWKEIRTFTGNRTAIIFRSVYNNNGSDPGDTQPLE